ncbi:MAG: hypothetical protein E7204_04750 [Veillonella sp.]|uniref:hypothetical protein n=1 Tax=Veillonella sp. TaxID=1926307 RepID=UPI0025F2F0A5|nr:hypothetical protein [Veillonella sp.]MBE6080137.1 hypothetical protein [Veillonella sp.]
MKRLVFLCLALCLLLAAGCAQVTSEIEVNSDFSGEWKATIQSPVPISKGDLLSAVTQNSNGQTPIDISKVELEAIGPDGKELKGDSATVQSQMWKLEAKFANKDELAKMSAAVFGRNADAKTNVIYPYGDDPDMYTFNLGKASGATTIEVDGKIVKESIGKGIMKDDDTVIYAAGDPIYFQFKKGGNSGLLIGGALVIVILAGIGYVIYRRRQTTV